MLPFPRFFERGGAFPPSRRGGEFLANAKRRERNDSVRQQVEMWARYLIGEADHAPALYPLLELGAPVTIELDVGIDDRTWLRHARGHEEADTPTNGDERQEAA